MLKYLPERRASAREMLHHSWLSLQKKKNYFMSEKEKEESLKRKQTQKKIGVFIENFEADESEGYDADIEDNEFRIEKEDPRTDHIEEISMNDETESFSGEEDDSFTKEFKDNIIFYDGLNLIDKDMKRPHFGYKEGIDIETFDTESNFEEVLHRGEKLLVDFG